MEQPIDSINGTAERLGISRTTVYKLIKAGKLEYFKLGRRTLIKTSSIRRLIDGE